MKIEVVASKKKPERLKISGAKKLAAVAGLIGLGGLMLGGSASAASFDESMIINPVWQQYMADVAAGNGSNWNLIPNKYKYIGDYGGKGSDTELPAKYNLVEAGFGTLLKNQGTDGDCWAFATTTAIESNIKKTQGIDVEFSPKQLDYLLAEGSPYYSYINENFDVSRSLGDGGNFLLASFPISGKSAPVTESSFFTKLKSNDENLSNYTSWRNFQDINTINYNLNGNHSVYNEPMSFDKVTEDSGDYVVTKHRWYIGDTDLVSTIKENVYKYGAVYVGTVAPEIEGCWDKDTKTIIDLGKQVCADGGHAMAIVGWDDDHEYTDPSTNTVKKGAFLLQNSWGRTGIWQDYGLGDADTIMEKLYDYTGKTEEQIAAMHTFLENMLTKYDAIENPWLAYDFDDSYENGRVDFASIQETKIQEYDHVYDSINQVEGFGTDDPAAAELVYTFSAGDNVEEIKTISLTTHGVTSDEDTEYAIFVDNSGTGKNYQKVGSITMPKGEMGQESVELTDSAIITGLFKVKVEPQDMGIAGYENYFSLAVYTDDYVPVPSTDGGKTPKTPNTGLFTSDSEFMKLGGAIIVVLALTAGAFGTAAYKNRKSLFHKVRFGKKGF